MSFTQEIETSQDVPEDVIFPPGDLYSDEPPLETDLHRLQIRELLQAILMMRSYTQSLPGFVACPSGDKDRGVRSRSWEIRL